MEWLKNIGAWFSSSTAISVDVGGEAHDKIAAELSKLVGDFNDFADGASKIMVELQKQQKDLEQKMALNFTELQAQIARLPEALINRDEAVAAKQSEIDHLKATWPDQTADQAVIDAMAADLKAKVDPFFPTVTAPVEEPVAPEVAPEAPVEQPQG